MANHMLRSLLPILVKPVSSRIVCQSVKPFSTCLSLSSIKTNISTTTPMTDIIASIKDQLTKAGVDEPSLSANYLLSCCMTPRDPHVPVLARDWEKHQNTYLSESQLSKLQTLLQCRMSHVPIQYIVGNWDFRDITLLCRPPVFIPRPETEQLVDIIKEHLPGGHQSQLLEIGPGTGAVSLSLLRECDHVANITCVERSTAAVELTRDNAKLLGLSDKVKIVLGRVGKDIELDLENHYDLIFSNPPYILRKDLAKLAPQISLYEDLRALDGGAEGLDVIMDILELAADKLASGGLVILEVDPCHPFILPPKLEKLQHSFSIEKVYKDFAGKDRFMVIKKI